MQSKRAVAIWGVTAMLALVVMLMPNSNSVYAQAESEIGINFVSFDCPDLETDLSSGCDFPTSATFEILADGAPLAGSPFTTGATSLLPGFFFYAPADAILTITELSVDPPGNAPAPGYDPLIVPVADIALGGCGGESICPTIEFINLPFAIADGPAGQLPAPSAEAAVLPATGTGIMANGDGSIGLPVVLLVLAFFFAGISGVARTALSRGPVQR